MANSADSSAVPAEQTERRQRTDIADAIIVHCIALRALTIAAIEMVDDELRDALIWQAHNIATDIKDSVNDNYAVIAGSPMREGRQ